MHVCIFMSSVLILGLSQICFQEFPKFFSYYGLQCSHYAYIMLLGYQHFLQSSWNILISECFIRVFSLQSDCSIREYQSKELCTMYLSALLQFAVSTDYFIREY